MIVTWTLKQPKSRQDIEGDEIYLLIRVLYFSYMVGFGVVDKGRRSPGNPPKNQL